MQNKIFINYHIDSFQMLNVKNNYFTIDFTLGVNSRFCKDYEF